MLVFYDFIQRNFNEIKDNVKQVLTNESEYNINNKEISSLISKQKDLKKVKKIYYEKDHLLKKPSSIKELYEKFKEEILKIDEKIVIKPTSLYIAFKINKNNFASIFIYIKKIDVCLSKLKENFNDPKDILEDIPETYRWGKICRFKCDSFENIPYAIKLIKQSYEIVITK